MQQKPASRETGFELTRLQSPELILFTEEMDLRCAPNPAPFPGTMRPRRGRSDPTRGLLLFHWVQVLGCTLHLTHLEFLSTGRPRAARYRCWPLVAVPDRDLADCTNPARP